MSNKKTTGFVAGAAGIALLMGGATFALWSASDDIDGGTITAGNLDVDVLEEEVTWTDISGGGNVPINDLGAFRIVPGDTIQGRFPIDVALEGDNLRAELSFDTGNVTGDLGQRLSDFEFEVSAGEEKFASTDPSNPFVPITLTPASGTSGDSGVAVPVETDGFADLTAVVKMTFDRDTPEQDLVQKHLALEDAKVELVQKHDDSH